MKIANIIEEGKVGGPQVRMVRVAAALSGQADTTIIMPHYPSSYRKHSMLSAPVDRHLFLKDCPLIRYFGQTALFGKHLRAPGRYHRLLHIIHNNVLPAPALHFSSLHLPSSPSQRSSRPDRVTLFDCIHNYRIHPL